MGLLTFIVAGSGFLLIGAWESITSSTRIQNSNPDSNLTRANGDNSTTEAPSTSSNRESKNPFPSSLSFIFVSIFSFLLILNSLVSLFNAFNLNDKVGSVLQLQVIAIGSLFFLYSIIGLLTNFHRSFPLPESVLDLILLFAFVEEFLLFYLQRKDKSGIENRYFDLLLVPISLCLFSTVLELRSTKSGSNFARLTRGVGLILQGMWFFQMGLSFFTNLIAHGCSLHEKSRGNYTIKCKGHEEYHRARAIATLVFNCHLAIIVVLFVGLFSIMAKKNGYRKDDMQYRPLGAEMQPMEIVSNFTLESDEDDEIKEEGGNAAKQKVEVGVNGYGSH